MTTATARLSVIAGPDRGKTLDVVEELVHVGSSPASHLPLAGQGVADRHLSIVFKQNRHAVSTPQADVTVDGVPLASNRWTWLPEARAVIRLAEGTELEFVRVPPAGELPAAAPGEKPSAETPRLRPVRPARKGERRSAPELAKIDLGAGPDPLLKLGTEGELPGLKLQEAVAVRRAARSSEQSNPLLLVALFAGSVAVSLLMLVVDVDAFGSRSEREAAARKAIVHFYGRDDRELNPCQVLLRRARQAASQGNRTLERQCYHEVLRLLRAENRNPLVPVCPLDREGQNGLEAMSMRELGLLGDGFLDMRSDEKLARLIAILLER